MGALLHDDSSLPIEDSAIPADFLAHPSPILAGGLVIFNDLYLKRTHPGFWSGKLSDIGICFLLPLILVALVEWSGWLWSRCLRRDWHPSAPNHHTVACLIAALYFSALQISDVWAAWHIFFVQTFMPRIRAGVTPDPTDLFALVMIPVAWRFLLDRRPWLNPHQGLSLQRKVT